jgi:hypothetical protein
MHKKTKIMLLFGFLLLGIIAATESDAHGLATSKQILSGNYALEFEYDALEQVPSGESIFYAVRLLQQDSGLEQAFDTAFVRIAQQSGGSVFSASLSPAPNTVGMSRFTLAMPRPGQYDVEVSFLKNSAAIAEGNFSYTAVPTSSDSEQSLILTTRHYGLIAISLAIGFIVGLLLRSHKT